MKFKPYEKIFVYLCMTNKKSDCMDADAYRYQAEDRSVTMSAARYIDECRDADKFLACCKECPNYGALWCCPPFGFDWMEMLAQYECVTLYATKITPTDASLPVSAAERLTRPERIRMEQKLLLQEKETGGRAFAYAGRCLHCPEGTCTRPKGLPCRHPELVRPSLEAAGFDIGKTLQHYFGIELKWGTNGLLPEYLVLVTAIFH